MLLAALILLAACANLGSLFAARAADRSREMAIRLALGSTRGRILRQLLAEAVIVSLAGGAIGVQGAATLLHWLSGWRVLPNSPIQVPVNPDATTYAVALLLSIVSGLLFGITPVRQVLRSDAYQLVKAGASDCADVAAADAARCAAGGADFGLRAAGDRFAGGRARVGALAA